MSMRLSLGQLQARVKGLPALPRALQELNAALGSETVGVDAIERIMDRDAALTMTALRLANSPFYGVSGRVVTLRDAVQVLGLNTLAAAVLTSAVMACFEPASCPGFDFDASWQHAVATAMCTQMLAQPRGLDSAQAYTAGLLHDVGRLVLASHFPREFGAVLAHAAEQDVSVGDAERAVLGVDHAEVGAMLAQHWRLAPTIVTAIGTHHRVEPGPLRPLLDVLHVADNIIHALDLTHEPDDMVPPLCLRCWERVALGPAELQTLFERLEMRMQGFGTEAVPA